MSAAIRVTILDSVRIYGEAAACALCDHPRLAWVLGGHSLDTPVDDETDVVIVRVTADAASAIRAVLKWRPTARVLVAGIPDRADEIVRAIEAGAVGYVLCGASPADWAHAVEAVYDSTFVCPPHVTLALFARLRERAGSTVEDDPLSGREREIVRLVARGLSNKQIARQLGLALHTVKNHVHRILRKLGVHRRRDAARAVSVAVG